MRSVAAKFGNEFSSGQGSAHRRRALSVTGAGLPMTPLQVAPLATKPSPVSGTPSTLLNESIGDGSANCLERAFSAAGPNDSVTLLRDRRDPTGHAVVERRDGTVFDPSSGKSFKSMEAYLTANPRYALRPEPQARGIPRSTLATLFSTPASSRARADAVKAAGLGVLGRVSVADPPPVTGGPAPISSVQGFAETGMTPEAIERLQRYLQDTVGSNGPYLGGVDGYGLFLDGTRAALQAFQRDQGIPQSGVLDPATISALQDPRPPTDPLLTRSLAQAPDGFGAPRGLAYETEAGLRQDFDGGYAVRNGERDVTFYSYDDVVLGEAPAIDPPVMADDYDSGVTSYRQGGETDWADDELGSNDVKIRDRGCAMTSASMCIATVTGDDTVNPQTLDEKLDANGGYDDDNNMRWQTAAAQTGTRVELEYFGIDEVNRRLSENPGVPIAMQVQVAPGENNFHWVVITHVTEENGVLQYHAIDPATGPSQTSTEGTEIAFTLDANDQLTAVAPYGNGGTTYATTSETGIRQFFPDSP
ncbi:MAG: hypothetical protein AMXMBFR34_21380 [Myxococcaceae bacterium]